MRKPLAKEKCEHTWLWVATGMGVVELGTKDKPYTTYKCPRCNEVKVVEYNPPAKEKLTDKQKRQLRAIDGLANLNLTKEQIDIIEGKPKSGIRLYSIMTIRVYGAY